MILIIDTTDNAEIFLALGDQDKLIIKKNIPAKFQQEEKLLQGLSEMIENDKLSFTDLKGIIVVTGPGSFSSLRIGLATANALAWSRQVAIVGLTTQDFSDHNDLYVQGINKLKTVKRFKAVEPYYGKEPNINV